MNGVHGLFHNKYMDQLLLNEFEEQTKQLLVFFMKKVFNEKIDLINIKYHLIKIK